MAKFVPPGYQSSRAAKVFSGSGAPDDAQGNANDWYLDRDTNELYQKDEAGAFWVLLGEIAGGGGGSAPLSGAGVPDSGVGGLEAPFGAEYYNTSTNPPELYKQMSDDPTDPLWVGVFTNTEATP